MNGCLCAGEILIGAKITQLASTSDEVRRPVVAKNPSKAFK
jgi:hypothetical protein